MLYTFELDNISLGKYEEVNQSITIIDDSFIRDRCVWDRPSLFNWTITEHVIMDIAKGEFYQFARNPPKSKFEENRRRNEFHRLSNVHSVTVIRKPVLRGEMIYILLNSIWEDEPHGILISLKPELCCKIEEGHLIGIALQRNNPKAIVGPEDQLKFKFMGDITSGLFLDEIGFYLESIKAYGKLVKTGNIEYVNSVSMETVLKFDTP